MPIKVIITGKINVRPKIKSVFDFSSAASFSVGISEFISQVYQEAKICKGKYILLGDSKRCAWDLTKTTRAFSGRLARGIENRFIREIDRKPEAILPFPAQNSFTRDIRNASTQIGSADFLYLWSGQGGGDLWQGSAADLVDQLFS